MSKSILYSVLLDAIPDSIRDDANVVAIATALGGEVQRMAAAARSAQWSSEAIQNGTVDGSRLQDLSSAQLDHVAWSWCSYVWDRDWTDARKASYIAGILNRKKHLGTAACIRDAFSQMGIEIDIVDCMTDSTIDAGRFMIYTDEPVVMASQWRMLYIVDRLKPVSRHYTWGHRVAAEGEQVVGAGAKLALLRSFNFIACQPVYELVSDNVSAGQLASGTMIQLDFEAVQPPSTNGYLYDAATDTLTAALWDDDAETVEVD